MVRIDQTLRDYTGGATGFTFPHAAANKPDIQQISDRSLPTQRRRQVDCRITLKKAKGLQHKASVLNGHHREIFRPWQEDHPTGMPKDHILINKIAILLNPLRQARPVFILVNILTRSMQFPGIVSGDP